MDLTKAALLVLSGVTLSSCGNEAPAPTPAPTPAPAELPAPLPEPALNLSPVILTLTANDVTGLGLPGNMAAEYSEEMGGIVMTGYVDETNSTGRTNGVNIELDSETEAKSSGRPITVTLTVKSADATQSSFAAAYSTAQVGNSGWRELEAGPDFSDVSFTYDVPARLDPGNDYIGILPTLSEGGAGVVVTKVEISFEDMPTQTEN